VLKTRVFAAEQWLPLPPERVFPFFADAFKLELITPPMLRFRVLTPAPIEMRAGTVIDYQLKLHGIPVRWRSEITLWEPPHRFVDQQRRGPYRFWRHEHSFADVDGGTLARDQVEYAVRGGAFIDKLLVAPDLKKIFEYRKDRLAELLAR
jgi:ligand-binding SRPBCC domain-containing protein